MAVAVWCYDAARKRAFESRMAACKAAQKGDREEAIRLTADAQRHDRIAEDWQKHVPEWQWKIYHEFQERDKHWQGWKDLPEER